MLVWVVAGALLTLIAFVYSELAPMYPVSGAAVRYPHISHGSFTSFIFGWVAWLGILSVVPLEVFAVIQYSGNYLPAHHDRKAGRARLQCHRIFRGTRLTHTFYMD